MKNCKLRLIGTVLLTFCFTVAFAQTQSEMNREACDDHKKADAELNKLYQQVLREYKADALFVQKMRNAQRAWVTYRDAYVDSLYPSANPQRDYGGVYPMCRCSVLEELTKRRVEELRRWVNGVEEGDVCSGSIKIRNYTGVLRQRLK
jgi:uncharacterized protein YecT (DUF1311 family)